MVDYDTLQVIRNGSLLLRRWEKRFMLLLISANIWIDQLINDMLSQGKQILNLTGEKIDYISRYKFELAGYEYKVGEKLNQLVDLDIFKEKIVDSVQAIDLLSLILLVVSVIFWIKIIHALLFVFADYKITRWEVGRPQFFMLLALVVNILIYLALNSIKFG